LSVIPRDAGVPGGRTRLLPSFCLVNYSVSITGRYTMFSTDGIVTAAVDSIIIIIIFIFIFIIIIT
jgi:hypothetical protein